MVQPSDIFQIFSEKNVLVIGDVMIDRYLSGSTDRISPEAPVPVVRLQKREGRLGGAANVALNLKALGARPYLCSVIGQDDNGDELIGMLGPHQLSTRGMVQVQQRQTTVKTRILAGAQHLLRVDAEDQHDLDGQEAEQLVGAVVSILDQKEIHAILFQDYNKGVLTKKVIREVMLEAIRRDIPTAVDPKSNNFWDYKRVELFKPNLKEIRAQVSFGVSAELESLRRAGQKIRAELGNQNVLITLSEKGIYYDGGGETAILPTHPRSIADVCGAGDTVFAVAGLGIAAGLPLSEIALLSNLAGGQVCEKVGVVPVELSQLEREYKQLTAKNAASNR